MTDKFEPAIEALRDSADFHKSEALEKEKLAAELEARAKNLRDQAVEQKAAAAACELAIVQLTGVS